MKLEKESNFSEHKEKYLICFKDILTRMSSEFDFVRYSKEIAESYGYCIVSPKE